MDFRGRLLGTLRAIQPVLDVPGVTVVGSQVPNLLEPDAASTLVVSLDVDIGVPVSSHAEVKRRLAGLSSVTQSPDEPSIWLPTEAELIEVNFVGMDAAILDVTETYVFEDPVLPLLVFGPLSLISLDSSVVIDGIRLPLPRPAGLLLEKLVTERSGEKGDRDLLVALGILAVSAEADLEEAADIFGRLPRELRVAARSNLTILALMEGRAGMPDPASHREKIAGLFRRLEEMEA